MARSVGRVVVGVQGSSGIFVVAKMGVNLLCLVKTLIFLLVCVANIVPKEMHGGKLVG